MQFKSFISEGGNATATIKSTGKNTLAQKIPIKEIGRQIFIKKFIEIFQNLNKRFKVKYKHSLWEDEKILHNGIVFNGSTSFIMNPEIHDDEVIPFKSSSGDIDIMVPSDLGTELWYLLDGLEDKEIIPGVVYKGMNKLNVSAIGNQMNSIFEVTFGKIVTQSQVDFELTTFSNNTPDEFSRFSHSSSLSDAQSGFKGVSHKYLLRSLAGGASARPDVVVITPASTFEKYSIQKKNKEPIVPNFLKFSVDNGLRVAYVQQFQPDGKEWKIEGKYVYKEIPTHESNYETSIIGIFEALFANTDSKDLDKMWSFVGIVELMKKYLDQSQIESTFERLLDLQWGPSGQQLERDSAALDMDIKAKAVNYMISKIPSLKKYDKEIQTMVDKFYENYGKRKLSEAKSFRAFLAEEGEGSVGTTSADIATVDSKLDLVKRSKPCKEHNVLNCEECSKNKIKENK